MNALSTSCSTGNGPTCRPDEMMSMVTYVADGDCCCCCCASAPLISRSQSQCVMLCCAVLCCALLQVAPCAPPGGAQAAASGSSTVFTPTTHCPVRLAGATVSMHTPRQQLHATHTPRPPTSCTSRPPDLPAALSMAVQLSTEAQQRPSQDYYKRLCGHQKPVQFSSVESVWRVPPSGKSIHL